jgi:hypothetical protein
MNRHLKKQLIRLKEESQQFLEINQRLEARNMELMCSNLKVDWNLTYLLPDGEPLPHVYDCCTEQLDFDDLSISDVRPQSTRQTTDSTRTTTQLSELNSGRHSADSSLLGLKHPTLPRIASPHRLKKRHKTYLIQDLDDAINEVIQMEMRQTKLETQETGVCGTGIHLKREHHLHLGPTKYYP